MTEKELVSLVEWVERLAVVETKTERLPIIEAKLDQLLELRNKGAGAFWLASSIIGTGIIGAVLTFITWLKG